MARDSREVGNMCVTCCSVQPPSRLRPPFASQPPPSTVLPGLHGSRAARQGRRTCGESGVAARDGSEFVERIPKTRQRPDKQRATRLTARIEAKEGPGIFPVASAADFLGHRSKLDLPRDSSSAFCASIGQGDAFHFEMRGDARNVSSTFCLSMKLDYRLVDRAE